jgi:hypothetical protein
MGPIGSSRQDMWGVCRINTWGPRSRRLPQRTSGRLADAVPSQKERTCEYPPHTVTGDG